MIQKSLLTRFAEAIDEHLAARQSVRKTTTDSGNQKSSILYWYLPTPGNVIFTLLLIGSLLWAQNVGAISLGAPVAATTSITGIPYQGRLADKNGAPLTQTVNMTFRLYAAASGGAPLWEEPWTGANSVQVSDGLFNVMLGSLTPVPQAVITGNNNLFLGITVGTDSEMSPRVQLGSVPFSTQALTVPDGSITKAKLAGDVQLVPADGSITSEKIADGAITASKIGDNSLVRGVNDTQTKIQFGEIPYWNTCTAAVVTFSVPFSQPPTVVITQNENVNWTSPYVTSVVTTTGFKVVKVGPSTCASGGSVSWIAVGT